MRHEPSRFFHADSADGWLRRVHAVRAYARAHTSAETETPSYGRSQFIIICVGSYVRDGIGLRHGGGSVRESSVKPFA